jgi:RNA polymerase sigma factor (sigma-70 family)
MKETRSTHSAWIRAVMVNYESKLIRYAWRFTGDRERARDVVQDTFMKLVTTDRTTLEGKLAPWLYTVCKNRALDVRQKESRMDVLEHTKLEARASSTAGPDTLAARNEDHAALLAVLAELPDEQQELFRLKFEHGMTYREIASVVNRPLSSVNAELTKTLRLIRRRLHGNVNIAQEG